MDIIAASKLPSGSATDPDSDSDPDYLLSLHTYCALQSYSVGVAL